MTLTCDKSRWQEDGDGLWLCLRTSDRAARAVTLDGPHTLTLEKPKKRRSLDANAYCWVLLDKLSAVLGRPKAELYRHYVRDIGGNSETVCVTDEAVDKLRDGWHHNGLGWVTDTTPSKLPGCTNIILYYGSSTYDTAQMSRLIDLIVEDCKAQEIETKTPDELSLLMARWEDG